MPSLIKDALISWWGAFVGRKRKKAGKQLRCAYFVPYGRRESEEPLKTLNE